MRCSVCGAPVHGPERACDDRKACLMRAFAETLHTSRGLRLHRHANGRLMMEIMAFGTAHYTVLVMIA